MSFCRTMWQAAAPIQAKILDLPFNKELAAGTLPRETFIFYMIQDAHYLGVFARALALAAAKAPGTEAQVTLAEASAAAIVAERSLHETFFAGFGVTPAMVAATPPSPACAGYGNFLLAAGHGQGYAVGLAAILPCFKIYFEVGKVLLAQATPGNPYKAWLDTYADEEFGRSVQRIEALADAAAAAAGEAKQAAMREAYLTAARYEFLFWDRAYVMEGWPV